MLASPLRPALAAENRIPIKTNGNSSYIALYDIVTTRLAAMDFDPLTGRGRLYHLNHVAVYRLGLPVMIADGTLLKSEQTIMRIGGEVFFPSDMALSLLTRLRPDLEFIRKTDGITWAVRQQRETTPPPVNPARQNREPISFIVIDAGHGGKDPGALGRGGAREKDIVLAVARRLNTYLTSKTSGITIKMTRSTDVFLELGQRTEFANKLLRPGQNGLFISIHANASVVRLSNGYETYYLSQNATNEEARVTAALENEVIVLENGKGAYNDAEYIEAQMLTSQILSESKMLADSVQNSIKGRVREFPSRGVKTADFFVLRGTLMPAVLVEVGYMTSDRELSYLKNPSYQQRMAESIGSGVLEFLRRYNASGN